MKLGLVNRLKAIKQWDKLVKVYKKLGVKVSIINQVDSQPDMVFCADQGLVVGRTVVLSNFRYPQRTGETKHFEKWYKNNGFTIKRLPDGCFFEGGGESFLINNKIFLGTGFRTNHKSAKALENLLGKTVVRLRLRDKRFYHLDTCLLVLDRDTAFYYPKGFDKTSVKKIKNSFKNLFTFKTVEVEGFAANSFVTGKHVIVNKGLSDFSKKLKKIGYKVVECDVSEFLKAGGGIHCLTGII